ncbi:MAG: peptidoglycan-binding domain-containing protein [Candidatus Nomurabacteria bacterium]|nr:peptidoglycan-binding domain-containing protein [Candidatus Nomurabacteria bacterium]
MNKLLKSIAFGLMIVTLVVVGVTFKSTKASADCSISMDLKQTMSGADVTCLQTKLAVTPATGYFGNITLAAVKAYQTAHGIPSTGFVGPLTRASLAGTAAPVASATCPAGFTCTSTTPVVAATCPAGFTCTANPGTTTTGSLSGAAGDLTITATTADTDSSVKEGDVATKVLAFKAQAAGSSINVNNVKVSFHNTDLDGSSTRIDRYASEVSVWMGSTKVGSALISDFVKSGTTYSKNISLTGATVAAGVSNKQTFYVAITAVSNIDSNDILTNDWTVSVDSTRWMDGTGMVMSDTTSISRDGTNTNTGVTFDSLASGDLKLTVSKGSMPSAGNVRVSSTTTTSVLMNEFKLKATGSAMTVNSISLALSTPGADTLSEATSEVTIKVLGEQIASNDETLSSDDTYVFTLDNPLEIAAGKTVTFDVYAKVNKISATLLAGENLLVSYATSNVEDSNGDAIAGGNRVGTAQGNTQNFFADGINLEFVSSSNDGAVVHSSTAPATTPDSGTFTIKYKVSNFGDTDLYVNKPTVDSTGTGAGQGNAYSVFKNGTDSAPAAGTYVASTGILSATGATTDDTVDAFFVGANDSRTFTLTVNFALDASDHTNSDGFYHVALNSVNWGTASDDSNTNYYSSNLGDFVTGDVTLSDYAI